MGNTFSYTFCSKSDLGFKEILANCVSYSKYVSENEIKRIEKNVKTLSG